MSAASVERPFDDDPFFSSVVEKPFSLQTIADEIMERHPDYRVEIIGGHLIVTPSADASHGIVLTELMLPFLAAGLHGPESKVAQGISLWLPGGEDYAIPDLVIVDADIEDHLIVKTAYDPVCFRLVLEVTSGNWRNDLKTKVGAYAEAKVPVYVVVDRKHQRLHVLTEPIEGGYGNHRVHAPGETVTLPDSIGAEVTLDVAQIIKYGQPKG